jgi:uncharacterized membrane protein YvlD (DUF360 family)
MFGAKLVEGFSVDSFWWALGFSMVVSLIVTLLESFDKRINK